VEKNPALEAVTEEGPGTSVKGKSGKRKRYVPSLVLENSNCFSDLAQGSLAMSDKSLFLVYWERWNSVMITLPSGSGKTTLLVRDNTHSS
jgi:hypothetical protein